MAALEIVCNFGKDPCEDLDMTDKKAVVTEKLQKREEERQAELLRKKKEKESISAVDETVKRFTETFNSETAKLESELIDCGSVPKDDLLSRFDTISAHFQKIQKYVTESTMFLPHFDLRLAQDALTKLQTKIQERREELLPKKKFAFRSKKQGEEKKPPSDLKSVSSCDQGTSDHFVVELAACKFINESNTTLVKHADNISQKDIALANLTDCTVKLYGSPSAIHMNQLKNCKIFSGPVSSSIFIREAVDCVFVLACQQLRIHTSKSCHFYIHVTSKAVIEDCSDVHFAPYNWEYEGLSEHYAKSGLNRERNNWSEVDDFNWLVAGAQSPNWSVLDETKRKQLWDP